MTGRTWGWRRAERRRGPQSARPADREPRPEPESPYRTQRRPDRPCDLNRWIPAQEAEARSASAASGSTRAARCGPTGASSRIRTLDPPGHRIFNRDRSDEPSSSPTYYLSVSCQTPSQSREGLAAQELDAPMEHGSWPIRWHDRQTLRKTPLRLVTVASTIGRQPLGEKPHNSCFAVERHPAGAMIS